MESIARLTHADVKVRREEVRELGRMKDVGVVMPWLIQALNDPDASVRAAAVAAFEEHPRIEALVGLSARLRVEEGRLRERVADAIVNIRKPEALAILLACLAGEDEGLVEVAVKALGQSRNSRAIPGLIGGLRDRRPAVRVAAAEAMTNYYQPLAVMALAEVLDDPQPEIRRTAVAHVARLHEVKWLTLLLERLRDEDVEVRRSAAAGVIGMDDRRAVPGLEAALADEDTLVRQRAAVALMGWSPVPSRALAMIPQATGDDLPEIRLRALAALRMMRHPRLVHSLIKALGDSSKIVSQGAADALSRLGLWAIPDALSKAARLHINVLTWIHHGLGHVDESTEIPNAFQGLVSGDEHLRDDAMWLIGGLNENLETAAAWMVQATQHQRPLIRAWALEALGWFQSPGSLSAIRLRLQDGDPTVRRAAQWALEKLGEPVPEK